MNILPVPNISLKENAIQEIPAALESLQVKTVMVVTDRGIVKAGIYDKLKGVLEQTGAEIILCDRVQPDPAISLVQEIAEQAREANADCVIGIGGGSSIDSAKVAAALVTNEKNVHEYLGVRLLKKQAIPIIAVPTTAGTGSEVTHIAILSDKEANLKKGLVSPMIIPSWAFLDPLLTVGLPPKITASTGMDALCHAIEAYTSLNASEYTDSLALTSIRLIRSSILEAFTNGTNISARESMLKGSLFAGMAFVNASVTAVHAFAYPLGGMFHVPHGLANSLMLPTIIEYNAEGNEERFAQVGKALTNDPDADAQAAIDTVNELSTALELPRNLAAVDIPEEAIPQMAEGALQITRLLKNNPRPIDLKDAVAIYEKAYHR